jgi:two-component system response regulator YesN
MFKVLIVDDEEMIRNGIKNAIPWLDYEISEVITAATGEEAEEIFSAFCPDIVLTDIRMPGMSGLDFLQKVKEIDPGVKVIILSGYDDFSYAQTAIKVGAFDYLLKTTDMKGLIGVINKAVEEVKKEKEKKEIDLKLRKQLELSLPLLKYRYLNELIYGGARVDDLVKRMEFVDIKPDFHCFLVGVAEIDNFNLIDENVTEEDRLLLKFGLMNMMQELLDNRGLCFESKDEEFVCLYYCDEGWNDRENFQKFTAKCEQIQNAIVKFFNKDISFGISNVGKSIYEVRTCYEEARSALEYKLLSGKGSIIHIRDVNDDKTFLFHLSLEQEKKLAAALRVGEKKQALRILEDIFRQLAIRKNITITSFHQTCIEMLGLVSRVLNEYDSSMEKIFGDNFVYFEKIKNYETFDETKQWLFSVFEKAIDYILDTKILKTKRIVETARQYIDKHYSEELTLHKVADVIHISPNYFSSLFSSETGQSFLEYVTSLRIEKAKQLLGAKDAKAYEVGEKVGYSNPYYFSRIFKKYTGLSPSEYKESIQNR